ncbi:MAG: ATPase [Planctomycetes bacterium SM23_32]|nr:MAG: ATPase [Planctomycetes bacterium SM23_32]
MERTAQEVRDRLAALRAEVHRVIVGQDDLLDRMLTGLLCGGHILLEGVPGLAKTLCATTLARALDATFHRIQFTPDLLPGDLLGAEIYDARTGEFTTRRGPIFANVILADEVNRAPAKVQSALLEAMQERQVSIGGRTFALPELFLVMATENPIEQEGTYPLPEAQVDRFFLKLKVPYPGREEELEIVERMAVSNPPVGVDKVLAPQDVLAFRRVADGVYVDDRARGYVLDLVRLTRDPPDELAPLIEWGASPRASMYMVMAARARALIQGRAHVIPDDVKAVAPDVLRHRLILTFEAEADGVEPDDVVERVLEQVPVP